MAYGITVKQDTGGSRMEIQCMHQNGLVYVVPAELSWVCSAELVHAHALAGLLKDLTALNDAHVRGLMQKWGVYFRERPLTVEGDKKEQA
jgi:hypothetical protein